MRERWGDKSRPWIGTLLERAPCRKRPDGTTEEELPERDRDWFMRAQNTELPLSRKKAIEICLRLWRHGIVAANNNIVRMLIDTTDDQLVIVPPAEARPLAKYLVEGLEKRANPINEAGRQFLGHYFARFESLTRRDAGLREAVRSFSPSTAASPGGSSRGQRILEKARSFPRRAFSRAWSRKRVV